MLEVGIWIHMPNTDPLLLLPTPLNSRGRNNCNIMISNKNIRHK